MAHPFAFEPERTTVAVDDVPHGQWCGVGADAHRVHLPAHDSLGAHDLAAPDQVEVGTGVGRREAQLGTRYAEFVGQACGQRGQGLHQGEAVDLEPQCRVHTVAANLQHPQALDAPCDGRDQVRATHVFHGPAGFQATGCGQRQILDTFTQRGGFLAHHGQETFAHGVVQIRVGEHVDRRLQVAQRAPAAFGHGVQQLVAQRLLFELARDVVQHQHEAAQHRNGVVVQHGGHLDAQQLTVAGGGHELRRRLGRAACHALADRVERVVDQLALEDAVDRAAQTDGGGTVHQAGNVREGAELQPGAVVVQQHAAIQVTHHHALRQLGHECGQTATLLLHLLAGHLHLLLHVVLQGRTLRDQGLDGVGQAAHLGAAGLGQGVFSAAGQLDARFLVEPRQCRDVVLKQPLRQQGEHHAAGQPGHQDQRNARLQHLNQQGAFRCRQRGPHHAGRHGDPHAQHQSGGRRRQRRTLRELHAAPASRARTWATRSLVENGLVT